MPALLLCFLAACIGAADMAPGVHADLVTPGESPLTYDLFLPKAFVAEPNGRFPLVFLSSSFHKPGFAGLDAWAEREAVVMACLGYDPRTPKEVLETQITALLAALSVYRIEPALRFAFASSGSFNRDLARMTAEDWGGYVDLDPPLQPPAHRHICIGVIAGLPPTNINHTESLAHERVALTRWGNPWQMSPIPAAGSDWQARDDAVPLLDWMVQLQRLSHPELPPEAIRAGRERLRRRIAALSALTDPAQRFAESDVLLRVDAVAKGRDAAAVTVAWGSAGLALALAETDLPTRNRRLEAIATNPRAKGLAPADRKALQSALAELRKDKHVRADSESRAALVAALQPELDYWNKGSAGDDQTLVRQAIIALEQVIKRWPGSSAATTAAAEITAREKRLE